MRANKYQVVHSISEAIAKTSDPWKCLSNVTKLISEYAGKAAVCALFAYNRNNRTVTLVAGQRPEEQELVGKFTFSVNEGITGMAIRSGRTVNVADQVKYAENLLPRNLNVSYHGLLVVPLIIGGFIIGALELEQPQRRVFSRKTLDMINEISTPLAMFIVNTMLAKQNLDSNDMFSLQQPRMKQVLDRPLVGTPITPGVAYGKAVTVSGVDELLVFKHLPHPVNRTPQAIQAEKELFFSAVDAARKSCQKTVRELEQTLSETDCNIFAIHAMLLDDPTMQGAILKHIEEGHCITVALAAALRTFTAQYRKIEDEYLRERIFDIKDVILNLKNTADNIRGARRENAAKQQPLDAKRIVIVAKELLPSQLVALPLRNVTGIVCEDGGRTSHVAILARALQKTMLVGVNAISDYVTPGDAILLDCNAGSCYINPPMALLRRFSESIKSTSERGRGMSREECAHVHESTTRDGARINFAGNIALLSELPAIANFGLSSVGLYRTEFMFMIRSKLPTEEEQYNILKRLVTSANVPVTLRLLDAGGDKQLPYLKCWDKEDNPALGWRGLRFLLSNQEILMTQLRAILRAAVHGSVNILVPMVADLFDLMETRKAIKAAEKSLQDEGIPYSADFKLGIMLEVPSAIQAIPSMLRYIDFISIGTNDLVQFMFAVDRGNPSVHKWYRQCHPIILKTIRDICAMVGRRPGKYVSLCGELAGSRSAMPLLIGTGLRNFSMTPSRVPEQRKIASEWTVDECRELLDRVLKSCHSEMDVRRYLEKNGHK